jgi:hypothetical protein
LLALAVFVLLFFYTGFSTEIEAYAQEETIASRTAEIDGAKLHYMTAGRGTPLILLHGYAETSLLWKPIIPALAKRFTVIAPDLPGIGDSTIQAHSHRDDRMATVVSGDWHLGYGTHFDAKALKTLPPGREETIIAPRPIMTS